MTSTALTSLPEKKRKSDIMFDTMSIIVLLCAAGFSGLAEAGMVLNNGSRIAQQKAFGSSSSSLEKEGGQLPVCGGEGGSSYCQEPANYPLDDISRALARDRNFISQLRPAATTTTATTTARTTASTAIMTTRPTLTNGRKTATTQGFPR
jgi:hypothetical protein